MSMWWDACWSHKRDLGCINFKNIEKGKKYKSLIRIELIRKFLEEMIFKPNNK